MKEAVRPALRAGAIAGLIVGTLLFLLNPPSLSGAEELIGLAGAATVLVLGTAWVTVTLAGREGPSEREVDRLVARSEELARRPLSSSQLEEFDELVAEAIERLPPEFQQLLEKTPVVVSELGSQSRAYGHYFGDGVAGERYENRIVIYRDTLERDFGHDPDLLAAQVERTLRHEVAHHLGWGESGVRELGL